MMRHALTAVRRCRHWAALATMTAAASVAGSPPAAPGPDGAALPLSNAAPAAAATRPAPTPPGVPPALTNAPLPATAQARDLFEKALALTQDGQYAASIPLYEQVLRLDATLKAAWESLGWAYWRVHREKDAIALWERLRAIDPVSPLPYNLLAKAATAQGDMARAVELNRRSLALQPNQFAVQYDLGRTLLWSGQMKEGIALLDTTLRQDPNRFDVMQELARALTHSWRYDQALPYWQRLREHVPDNTDYLAMEALCLLHGNQPDAARAGFEKVLAKKADDPVALEGMASLEQFGPEPEKAAPHLRTLLQSQPDPVEKEHTRVRLLNLLVRLHHADPLTFTLQEAIDLSADRLAYNPKSVDALLLRGELLLQDLKYADAEALFVRVLTEFNPHNVRARRGLFETYIAAQQFGRAREQLDAVRQFNPRDPYLDYYLARLEGARGNFGAAYAALDRLEAAGRRGTTAVILYHGLTPSRYFVEATAVSRLRDHLQAMRDAGFEFVTTSQMLAAYGLGTNAAAAPPVRPVTPGMRSLLAPLPALSGAAGTLAAPLGAGEPVAAPALGIRVAIHFDDARNDSMRLGTPVSREFGIVFTEHVPVCDVLRNMPFTANWQQLEEYVATGCWEIGSHLIDASDMAPVDAEGYKVHDLPNRLWRKDLGRLETPEEYGARIDREFSESRRLLEAHIGRPVDFVAYPFGDIGQEVECNVQDPVQTLLAAARTNYDAGFIQTQFGFAMADDDPMLLQRHEMDPWMDGTNVVMEVYARHPVFLARRTRAEYAALEGKQYRALENLQWLAQNHYPTPLQEETRRYVDARLSGGFVRPTEAAAAQKAASAVDTLKPRLRADAEYDHDNASRTLWRFFGGGGVNLGERVALDAKAGTGRLTQDATNAVAPETRHLSVTEQSAGVRGTLSFVPDPLHPATDYYPQYLTAGFLQRAFSGDADTSVTAFEGETQFRPLLSLDVMLRFEHDLVPSALAAVDDITYNAWIGTAVYRLRDWWDITGSAMRYDFSDDNLRDHWSLGTGWLLDERTGLRAGLRYDYTSADEPQQAYWTPFQLSRFLAEAQLRGNYLRTYYKLRATAGFGKENVRPEEDAAFEALLIRARQGHFDPGPAPHTNWEFVFGLSAAANVPLQAHWELNGEVSYNRNPNYEELSAFGGIGYKFR